MYKKIIISLVLVIEFISFKLWLSCTDLIGKFHFSYFDVTLKLQEAITNDVGYSPLLARFFHNKLVFSINTIMDSYLQFWDIRFGVMLFMLIGYFGILCGLWYLILHKNKYKWIIFMLLLMLPFIEVFKLFQNFQLRLIFVIIPYFALSIYGLSQFMNVHKRKAYAILIMLIIFSGWYSGVHGEDIFFSCIK